MNNLQHQHAIACMSGGYKTVFTHGVLCALEKSNYPVDAYAGCSSSAIIAAYAAIHKINMLDISLWIDALNSSKEEGSSQSNAVLNSLDQLYPTIREELWHQDSGKLFIATSFVKNKDAEGITQSNIAKRFGQKLLIDALRGKSEWKDENLEPHLFGTESYEQIYPLTKENFKEVAYASTRMLHAWHIPAFIDGKAYIDGSYTCLCPVIPLVNIGYQSILCILTEHNSKKLDMFSSEEIPNQIGESVINIIRPDVNLKDIGVDFYNANEKTLKEVFSYGYQKGIEFLDTQRKI